MSYSCPECGAIFREDDTCQTIFDALLVLEFSDPDYGEVHMLTVACFMIQHGRYSDAALRWIEQKLRATLDGMPAEQIRRQVAREAGQGSRTWKVTRQPGEPPLPKIHWSLTIADVRSYQDARSYREWVRKWAEVTLGEMKPLLAGR